MIWVVYHCQCGQAICLRVIVLVSFHNSEAQNSPVELKAVVPPISRAVPSQHTQLYSSHVTDGPYTFPVQHFRLSDQSLWRASCLLVCVVRGQCTPAFMAPDPSSILSGTHFLTDCFPKSLALV